MHIVLLLQTLKNRPTAPAQPANCHGNYNHGDTAPKLLYKMVSRLWADEAFNSAE